MEVNQYDIIVCGDSFCCSTEIDLKIAGRRAHFSQILEDKYGYTVLNLAHGGVSNICILFQLREAEALKPKAIVYNRTFTGRVDLMLHDDFQVERGLKNFVYWDNSMSSYEHGGRFGKATSSCISTVYQGLRKNPFFKLSDAQYNAVDTWLIHFHNDAKEKEIQDWMFEYWHNRLKQNGIQSLPFGHSLVGKAAWDFCYHTPDYDTPFHTDKATQQIIADNVHRLILQGIDLSCKD